MENKIKYCLISMISLIILVIILFFSLKVSEPEFSDKGFHFTINGKVILKENFLNNITKPNIVRIFPSIYSFNNLCTHTEISNPAKIKWDGNIGNYSLSGWLPIEQEVIITPNCNSCNPKRIYISPEDNLQEINLDWDMNSCIKNIEDFNTPEEVLDWGVSMLDRVSEDLDKKEFNISIKNNIRETITEGRNNVIDSRKANDLNESLKRAFSVVLFGWSASNKLNLAELGECIIKIGNLMNNHKDECYMPSYEGYELYKNANLTYHEDYNILSIVNRDYRERSLDQLKNKIKATYDIEGKNIQKAENHCSNALKLINNSFTYQKLYCIRQNITFNIINYTFIIISLLIGVYLGKMGRRW